MKVCKQTNFTTVKHVDNAVLDAAAVMIFGFAIPNIVQYNCVDKVIAIAQYLLIYYGKDY